MTQVVASHQTLISIFIAVISTITVIVGLLGFKTLPSYIKGATIKQTNSVLDPKIKDLEGQLAKLKSTNEEQSKAIDEHKKAVTTLQGNLHSLQVEYEHQLQITKKLHHEQAEQHNGLRGKWERSMVAISQSSYGLLLEIRAEAAQDPENQLNCWKECAEWLQRASDNAEHSLDVSMCQWILLNLAFAQKRAKDPFGALESAKKALQLAQDEKHIALFNAACYAALCKKEDEFFNYLESALQIEPSDAQSILPNEENGIKGEADMEAYWKDPRLLNLIKRFTAEG